MKTICLYVLLGALLLAVGCTSGESDFRAGYDFSGVNRVAIADVFGDVEGEVARNQISDFFVGELLSKGYAPVERAQVQTILEEQQFQASDITTREGVARAGQILNVQAIIVVNVRSSGEEVTMTAKLTDVQDGSILWMGTGSGSTGKTLATIAGATAGAAAGGAVAGGDSSDKVAGAIVGGILGGVAGQALTPQQAQKTKEIIEQMCKYLPYRDPVLRR
ncbi:MAG: hypothetical protein ACYTEL_21730 [Planctomycetota bacterium]